MKILESHQNSRNKAHFKIAVREVVDKLPLLSSKEKGYVARVVSSYKNLDEETCMKELIKLFGKLERRGSSREKIKEFKNLLSGIDSVFYVCSKHNGCANDHKDWEGKVYYDRFWRTKNPNMPSWLEDRIDRYIARMDLRSIQWVTKGPVWLGTRPYCKHYFEPVNVYKVLTADVDSYVPVTRERRTKRGSTEEYVRKKRGL